MPSSGVGSKVVWMEIEGLNVGSGLQLAETFEARAGAAKVLFGRAEMADDEDAWQVHEGCYGISTSKQHYDSVR